MIEPNPYEAPQAAEPLSVGAAAKRAGGIGIILLLTPLAVMIASGASCTAAFFVPWPSHAMIQLMVFPGIPCGVLAAMTSWAAWRHYRSTTPDERHGRITFLILTPFVVAGSTLLGLVAASALDDWMQGELLVGAIATLLGIPLITLVAMLYLAWRCDRARI